VRILIVEDERPAADELEHLLSVWPAAAIAGIAGNGPEGLRMAREVRPDVIFLDIEMPGMSGLEVAGELLADDSLSEIVFVTAYDEFALRAFEVRAVDYLVKPVDPARLSSTMARLFERIRNRKGPSDAGMKGLLEDLRTGSAPDRPLLSVPAGDKYVPVFAADIILATTEGRSILLVTRKGEFRLNDAFARIADLLSRDQHFFQCHRAFVVNLKYIVAVELWFHNTYQLKMEQTGIMVPVSRSRVGAFREIMNIRS